MRQRDKIAPPNDIHQKASLEGGIFLHKSSKANFLQNRIF